MRTITIQIPDTYCNDCVFFSTADPDPESCTGFAGFRSYWCSHFGIELEPDWNKTHKARSMFETEEKKVPVCDKCRSKYK